MNVVEFYSEVALQKQEAEGTVRETVGAYSLYEFDKGLGGSPGLTA
jgi:hypothetical protein